MMSAELSGFRRFLHWGPITALSIIKCITLTTLYMNSMWWPPNLSIFAFLNQALFLMLSSAATFNYVMATVIGPGTLPKQWQPQDSKATEFLQYCKICEGYKAPRSHHCRKCNRCIKKMDHHCPWINHCVGWANHGYFTLFLAFSVLGSFHGCIILCGAFYRGIYRFWYLTHGLAYLATVQLTMWSLIICIFAMGLAVGVVIALGMLLYFQLKSIVKNQTAIEMWIIEKALFRRHHNTDLDDFIFPYDLGWRQNIKQVFESECVARGNGIEWPVREGCEEFTLTREQIAQKFEKRARTRTFKCIRKATGSYVPLWSQGFRVCLATPCTDEPRICLEKDDIIRVTRFRRHWLFGERVLTDPNSMEERKRKGPVRGWFPRRCAIELIEPTLVDDEPDTTEILNCERHNSSNDQIPKTQRNGYNRKKIN
uniref:Palmitoyltransferase n=1 Tax=Glossina palpalis gambiensis TaxID=67801 RepID=A0A1B0BKZ0_9MUSC